MTVKKGGDAVLCIVFDSSLWIIPKGDRAKDDNLKSSFQVFCFCLCDESKEA